MATLQTTLAAERWLDEVLLFAAGTADQAGADSSDVFRLPDGLGDVALLCGNIYVSSIATAVTDANIPGLGGSIWIQTPGGSAVVDVPGCSITWRRLSATVLWGSFDPDALLLWRQGEFLALQWPELDTNATPTGDVTFRFKCVRVRPQEAARAPIRFVR